ncbi:MAG: DUF4345 domain-containing protein [Acidobacteriota bacterium]
MQSKNGQTARSEPTLALGAISKMGSRVAVLEDRRMNNRLTLLYLFLSGLLLLGIGLAILLAPHSIYASNGIVLGDDPSLLSEIRAPGGFLTASSILILLGTFRRFLRSVAIALTVLVYGSFGLARLVGLALDGLPAAGLVGSTAIELIVAAIGLLILWRSGATRSGTAAARRQAPGAL